MSLRKLRQPPLSLGARKSASDRKMNNQPAARARPNFWLALRAGKLSFLVLCVSIFVKPRAGFSTEPAGVDHPH